MPLPLIVPLLLIGGGTAGILAAVFSKGEDGEPVEPIAIPEDAPSGASADSNEIEALARVIASEAGAGTPGEKKAIAWTVRNQARARKKSIYELEFPWRSQKGGNPPFSSARPASDSHRALARGILAEPISNDSTGGATSFFEPRMQDIFFKAGELARAGETGNRTIDGVLLTDITRFKFYKKDADTIRQKWGRGSGLYASAGRFEFWGSSSLLAKRGGEVKTIVGGFFDDVKPAYLDIPDPLLLLPKFKRRG